MGFTRTILRRGLSRRRPPASPAACPQCASAAGPDDAFCPQCGTRIRVPTRERVEKIRREHARRGLLTLRQKIVTGRVWILLAAMLALIHCVQFFTIVVDIDRQLAGFDAEWAARSPEDRADLLRLFEDAHGVSRDDIRRVRTVAAVQRVAYLVLGIIYFALSLWSARNAFAAALLALMIFLATATVHAIVDARELLTPNGLLIHVLMFAGLASAVSSAYRYRCLYEQPAPAAPPPAGPAT
jgi:hypothetical protein